MMRTSLRPATRAASTYSSDRTAVTAAEHEAVVRRGEEHTEDEHREPHRGPEDGTGGEQHHDPGSAMTSDVNHDAVPSNQPL